MTVKNADGSPTCLKGGVSHVSSLFVVVHRISHSLLDFACSVAAQPPPSTSTIPRIRKAARPSTTLLLRDILGRPKGRSISSVGIGASVGAEIPSNSRWCLNVVPSALECRIEPCEKVIKMRCKHTRRLLQGCLRATHDQGECKHCPGKQLDRNLQDNKMGFLATVILRVGVNECEHEGLCEDVGAEEETARYLFRR